MPVVTSSYAGPTDLATYGLMSPAMVSIDTATILAHLSAASDLLDSYLGSRYDLPLQSWGPVIVQKVSELAAESILAIRGYDPNDAGDMTTMIRGKAAKEWLKGIQDGTIQPNIQDSNPSPGQFGGPNTLSSSTTPSSQATLPGSAGSQSELISDGASPTIIIGRPKARGWR